jgi:hypothetical protein
MNGALLSVLGVVVFCGLVIDAVAFAFAGSAVALLIVKAGV